ncbi:MAG: hypothetical protein ACRD39_03930 [Nitrososphaeraceae archaeon]
MHNDDLIDAISLAVTRRKELPLEVTLLIGENESPSYDELQRAFGRLIHGVEWKTQPIPPAVAKVGLQVQNLLSLGGPSLVKPWMIDAAGDNIELDISRARTLLGWKPQRSLRDTLPKMVSALKADPFTWYRENELKLPLWLQELLPSPAASKATMMEPHELIQLGEQVQREIEASTPIHNSETASVSYDEYE